MKLIREALGVRMVTRDGNIRLMGDRANVLAARDVLRALNDAVQEGTVLNRQQVHDLIGNALATAEGKNDRPDDAPDEEMLTGPAWTDHLSVYASGRPIKAKTPNQQAYLDAIRDHDVVFGVGPAGTGKTFLAVAAAVHLLKSGRAKRLILCRPAVEAGERLGFLPGDLQQKVNPYLRPLMDALNDMMDYSTLTRFMTSDVVEIVPLAFMRGRTLNRAIIILDEAQNTTRTQMKMFLTRMGMGSKVIVTGDPTQTDLHADEPSGLLDALMILRRTEGVAMVGFDERDIVRHTLVQRIVEAYGASDKARQGPAGERQRGSVRGGSRGGPGGSMPSTENPSFEPPAGEAEGFGSA
ncbi:MAG TPA: PhoH family protein [Phycisphaerales bacterium]|nr:PhoH family protein [Phycisphaerales bacterium]